MKKCLSFLLILILLISLPTVAFSHGTPLSTQENPPVAYDGYLIHVYPQSRASIAPFSFGAVQIEPSLYLIESPAMAHMIWPSYNILYVEPNYQIVLFDTEVVLMPSSVNDPLFHRQWSLPFIGAPSLWEGGHTGRGVTIAVIDSGISPQHEDLNPQQIAPGFNFLNHTTNVIDRTGHGTQIAGIIAAGSNNHVGIAGLLSEVTLLPLKVFDEGASNVSVAIRAIHDAVTIHGADVLNLSWGIPGGVSSLALENAINFAYEQGVIIVAAAGNLGSTARIYPASFENVISVGAFDFTGNVASFSQRNDAIFVLAPGVSILTTGHQAENSYVYVNGTSFAAPFVSALAAVMLEENPNATTEDFRNLLRQSARSNGDRNNSFGYGTIDVPHFLALLQNRLFFHDISNHWARESIEATVNMGLFLGTAPGVFSPNEHTSRASFVTLLGRLYRQMGGNIPNANDTFLDTQDNSWYSNYVAWAYGAGIAMGTDEGYFLPHDIVTRQEAAVFLNRFILYTQNTQMPNPNFSLLEDFADYLEVSHWAVPSLIWSVELGVITGAPGEGNTRLLLPQNPSTRAEVAVMVERFIRQLPQYF